MRIAAGSRRGQRLDAPPGGTTRPTAARARESLFDILGGPRHLARWKGRAVADFFAGTGALGLEALSRGAARCSFLETDPAALRALDSNIARMKLVSESTVLRADAGHPPRAREACGVLFFDPPYRDDVAADSLTAAAAAGWLASDGLAVIQLHPKAGFSAPPGFETTDDRRYGATRFLFLEPVS
jgi:16S rRNA (guanine966-N2)-methyltransferase